MQFIVRLLPLEMRKGGNEKSLKLPISANLSYNGVFVGLKVTPRDHTCGSGA